MVVKAKFANGRTEKLAITKCRKQLLFSCAIDVSGSMCGAPIKAAMAMMHDMYADMIDGE